MQKVYKKYIWNARLWGELDVDVSLIWALDKIPLHYSHNYRISIKEPEDLHLTYEKRNEFNAKRANVYFEQKDKRGGSSQFPMKLAARLKWRLRISRQA